MRHSRLHRRQSFTLGRHQSAAHFGLVCLPVGAADAGPSAQVPVIWAIGTLPDGQREKLGIWRQRLDADTAWPQVLGDLWTRGVERIGWAATTGVSAPASVHLPGRPRVDSWCGTDSPPSLSRPKSGRRGRLASAAEHFAQKVQANLAQSVRQHGSFESDEAAVNFVAARLERLDLGGATGR
jgi:hypothetical protein